ncbi:HD domain-containing phosphohydrolase [uncultured Ilyobacter sp.]|uniref:HD-GYP domain-containing protein n=1 Tax=uncultured Ilyobacter sp. TaxID=544433 RepID=UPI0029C68A22|nr:HD domain-containing phosphohydrolase [uncultured Ilyobacter sp.]
MFINSNYKKDNILTDNILTDIVSPSEIVGIFQKDYSENFRREKVKKNFLENLLVKLHTLDASKALFHLKMVGEISALLSRKYGFSESKVKKIEFFAKIHDLGKVGIPEKILNKPGKLTKDEFEVVKEHTEIGYHLINKFGFSKIGENIIRYHHEKWNGKGYRGLVQKEIPIEARIVSIADVYDALRMKRTYKESFTHEKAVAIINEGRGEDFDPELVDIFLKCHQEIKIIYNRNIN